MEEPMAYTKCQRCGDYGRRTSSLCGDCVAITKAAMRVNAYRDGYAGRTKLHATGIYAACYALGARRRASGRPAARFELVTDPRPANDGAGAEVAA